MTMTLELALTYSLFFLVLTIGEMSIKTIEKVFSANCIILAIILVLGIVVAKFANETLLKRDNQIRKFKLSLPPVP